MLHAHACSFFDRSFRFDRYLIRIDLELCGFRSLLIPQLDIATSPPGVEDTVPEDEERLAEVGLDAPALVVDVVVGGVVAGDALQRIPWQSVSAVVVDGLDGGKGEEEHALAGIHEGDFVGQTGAESVEEKSFKGVVVQSAVRVWDVESVVTGVESDIQPLVHVHSTMQEVLPCIDDNDGYHVLDGRD